MTATPTIRDVVQNAQATLREVSNSARTDAEILLTLVLGCTRTYLRTWPEHVLTIEQHEQFLKLLARRLDGEPIAHITGERDFWDMTLRVSADTLIPRPETETLVELALAKIPPTVSWQIADLGTGSGAIALAIARERPQCEIVATDISPAALDVARDNATRLQVQNIRFVLGRWFEALAGEQFEMIVSNPPYVHPSDPHLQQGDLRFEPLTALQSGPDGLSDIRHICAKAREHLRAPGWLLLEHGFDQGDTVPTILRELGYQQIQVAQDLAHHDRVSLGAWAGAET
jgi:release factor glutamine methyltransferase